MSMRREDPEAQAAFYGSRAWKRCRTEYKKSVGGLCERCKTKGLIEPGYIVHHKEYINARNITDPNILLNFDNLELLCMDCHNKEHGREKKNKRFMIGENGKVFCIPTV